MKKIMMILLGIALVTSMSGAVAGDIVMIPDGSDMTKSTNSHATMVYYSIAEENFVIVIPHSFSFSSGTDEIIGLQSNVVVGNITAKSVTLKAEHNLYVNVTSEHGFKMVLHENDEPDMMQNISYQLEYTNPDGIATVLDDISDISIEQLVLKVPSGTKNYNVPITFNMTGSPKDIGTFKDKVTFTASIRLA